MLQRLGIRGKLLLVVAVPTIVLLLASGLVVVTAATSLTSARNTAQLVNAVQESVPLIEDLQSERGNVSNYLRTINDGANKRITARTAVNTSYFKVINSVESEPSLAAAAQQLSALWAGADGQPGIEAIRGIATATGDLGEFPNWPDTAAVGTANDQFAALATAIEGVAATAPAGEGGDALRALPDLVRAEATATSTYLNDAKAYSDLLPDDFNNVDSARMEFRSEADKIDGQESNERVIELNQSALKGIDDLSGIRTRVKTAAILPTAAEDEYTAIISDLLQMEREVANTVTDQRLASFLQGHAAVQDLVESMRLEEEYVQREIKQGTWVTGEFNRFQELYFKTNNALENATLAVAPLEGIDKIREFGASFSVEDGWGFESVRDSLLNNGDSNSLVLARDADWPTQVDEELAQISPIRSEVFRVVKARSADLERTNLIQTVATLAVGVVVVALSLILTQAIARRIINPLRRLTTTATAVRQELPRLVERVALPGQTVDVSEVQIPVESQDEVGRLAEAFNSVNAATLAIAAEQAALRGSISEMFVNVARRDQVLLNRQLASIDEMERTQDDPETLTRLFALDHLATRMRRNSESLLVLAGIDTGRRLRRPMPLSDVIRTASSEIELYERVVLELDADPAMLGHSALTAAHLFAELLENATVFSDPGTPVVVRTMEQDGGFVVTITDSGIGMTTEELAEANSRVASTAASEILGAQRLGLFVVGRIARRVGARVHLDSAEGKGTMATIVMPPSLFDLGAGYAPAQRNAGVADEARHAPSALVQEAPEEEPTRAMSAYTPAAVQEGNALRGREALVPEAPRKEPRPEPQAPSVVASAEPTLDAVHRMREAESDESVVTEVGLPARRKRSTGPEAPKDTNSIIGIPQRASDEQLSALASAADSGFTPILAAEDVNAESAEARSRVFRGFRPMRSPDMIQAEPDTVSLGRAFATPAAQGSSEQAAADVEPSDGASQAPAIQAADVRDESFPSVTQSPLISRGFDPGAPASGGVQAVTFESSDTTFVVPQLEDDEPAVSRPPVPVQASAEIAVEPQAPLEVPPAQQPVRSPLYPQQGEALQQQVPVAGQSAPVQQGHAGWGGLVAPVSQYDVPPTPFDNAPYAPYAPYPPDAGIAAGTSAGVPSPASASWPESPAPAATPPAPFLPPVAVSTPSLDELILDGARHDDAAERSGFFGKLFGKGKRPDDAPMAQGIVTPGPLVEPVGPLSGALPMRQDVDAGAYPAATGEQLTTPSPWQGHDDQQWENNAQAPWSAAPQTLPVQPEPHAPQPTGFEPMGPPVPALSAGWPLQRDPEVVVPAAPVAPAQAFNHAPPFNPPAVPVPFDSATGVFYSPDQLARPVGWEAAGATALQAAAPEVEIGYRPLVQIEPEDAAAADAEITSAVFSELSSLAFERPKVEKTRAGLARRTPVAPPSEPVQAVAPSVPVDRNPEEVRSRFSAFYSATRRPRSDVGNLPGAQ